ncbi:MAG TPA: complex I NDUFA9 subunit family protein [Paucimonas sp.]|nr:complex I NDUFA9 subunit family protein [Paucimonas sp.]
MKFRFVLVLGGSGFIGSHLVAKLNDTGRRVIVATRHYEHAKHLAVFPAIDDIVEADIHDDAALNELMIGMDAVVNLVGILHAKPGRPGQAYGPQFARVHVELPRRIAMTCRANGVRRYLHMSALGASRQGPSMYQRSKADGERAATGDRYLEVTVFRPSVVFGEEDRFLNLFARMQRFLPFVPLAGAETKFQPIYVQDVAQAFAHALDNDHTIGRSYELAGPNVYTLRELVRLAGRYSGHPRSVVGLPDALARAQAWLFERLPGQPLLSRDNLDSMKIDNVASGPISPDLGITPTPLEAVAPFYLAGRSPHHRFGYA